MHTTGQLDPHLSLEYILKTRPETPLFFTFSISICPILYIDMKNRRFSSEKNCRSLFNPFFQPLGRFTDVTVPTYTVEQVDYSTQFFSWQNILLARMQRPAYCENTCWFAATNGLLGDPTNPPAKNCRRSSKPRKTDIKLL